ncbi:hypothetical protein Clacol_007895 [Clathrus columnatus]|uniref:F-box domain-containing protein n=1 Tax=Clathrus columnatus TaxID=1419009 RepID=A0AAV5AKI2_9AGAM|nr:hypothetical protein Clacol_007895 [Clathrus columnatus]
MHPVLKIREMVDQILSWLPPSTLTLTARVNHLWFHSSLADIWRLVTLTEALTPLQLCTCGMECPATRFRPDNIKYLFPNLHSLRFHSRLIDSLPDFALLISPTLQNVGLRLFNLPHTFFRSFCETLAARVKGLRLLQICFDEPPTDNNRLITSLKAVLKLSVSTLIHAQLPEAFLAEEILQELGKYRNLYDFTIGGSYELMFDEGWVCKGYTEDETKEEGFGYMVYLSLTGSQSTPCRRFLDRPGSRFSSLAAIEWHECLDLDNITSVVTTIVNTCPLLEVLTLGESDMYFTPAEHRLPPIVPWETIQILLHCVLLINLSLHCCRISMTSEDLVELLTSRLYFRPTAWQVLQIYTAEPLAISDLLLFAKYCPYIKTLGIHFDGRSIGDNAINDIRAQTSTQYIPPPEFLPYGVSEAEDQYEGPNKLVSVMSIDFAYSPLDHELVPELVACLFEICDDVPSIHGWDPEWEIVSSHLWLKHQNPRRITFVTGDETNETNVALGDVWI